jgi:hypothetical protein
MRKLPYLIAAIVALVVPSPTLAATSQAGPDGSGGEAAGVDGPASDDGDDPDGEDRSWTMDESDGGGCSHSGLPPAGRNASLALLALAFMSFGIRLPPRRRRARVSARRQGTAVRLKAGPMCHAQRAGLEADTNLQ